MNIDVYVNDNYVATKEVNNNFEVTIPYKVAENGEYEVKVYAKDVNKVFDDTLLEGCPQSVTKYTHRLMMSLHRLTITFQ